MPRTKIDADPDPVGRRHAEYNVIMPSSHLRENKRFKGIAFDGSRDDRRRGVRLPLSTRLSSRGWLITELLRLASTRLDER